MLALDVRLEYAAKVALMSLRCRFDVALVALMFLNQFPHICLHWMFALHMLQNCFLAFLVGAFHVAVVVLLK